MKMNEEAMDRINKESNSSLFVESSLKGVSVFKNGWEICELKDLSNMIDELSELRDAIAKETGLTF